MCLNGALTCDIKGEATQWYVISLETTSLANRFFFSFFFSPFGTYPLGTDCPACLGGAVNCDSSGTATQCLPGSGFLGEGCEVCDSVHYSDGTTVCNQCYDNSTCGSTTKDTTGWLVLIDEQTY